MSGYWLWTHGISGIVDNPVDTWLMQSPDGGLNVRQDRAGPNNIYFAIPTIAAVPNAQLVLSQVNLVYKTLIQAGALLEMLQLQIFDGTRHLENIDLQQQPLNRVVNGQWNLRERHRINNGILLSVIVNWIGLDNTDHGATVQFHSAGIVAEHP